MARHKTIPDPSACLCINVRRASRAITAIYDGALATTGLKVTQFSLLKNIDTHGPLNVSALAKILMLDRTTLVRNLKPLENAGYVENAPSKDPRERQVSVTEEGRQLVQRALPLWKETQARVSEHIGEEQLQALRRLVTVLEGVANEIGAVA